MRLFCDKNVFKKNQGGKCKNYRDFWSKIRSSKSCHTVLPNTIDGSSGAENIANLWKAHFESLLNSVDNQTHKSDVLSALSPALLFDDGMQISARELADIIKDLPNGKACGSDGISNEHLKNAGPSLCVHLSLLFTSAIVHNFIPDNLLATIIVPIVKNKSGNISSTDNYRPIAITSALSKVLEALLLNRLKPFLQTSDSQFGFKPKHGTDMCVFTLKQIIEYYRGLGSPVFVCFLDASKAFDRVNHWALFSKLIDRKVPLYLVRFLFFWYKNQRMCVRWGAILSPYFSVTNGVRQGSLLSPYLFNLYIDDLSVRLNNAKVGC